MAINNNLPTYGATGWGATLNNYLKMLESRTAALETTVNSSSNSDVATYISGYRGSGLTKQNTSITEETTVGVDDTDSVDKVQDTIVLSKNSEDKYALYVQNFACYISPTANTNAVIYNASSEFTVTIAPPSFNSTSIIAFAMSGKDGTFDIIPCPKAAQNASGTVNIPEALRPYMGGKEKLIPTK